MERCGRENGPGFPGSYHNDISPGSPALSTITGLGCSDTMDALLFLWIIFESRLVWGEGVELEVLGKVGWLDFRVFGCDRPKHHKHVSLLYIQYIEISSFLLDSEQVLASTMEEGCVRVRCLAKLVFANVRSRTAGRLVPSMTLSQMLPLYS